VKKLCPVVSILALYFVSFSATISVAADNTQSPNSDKQASILSPLATDTCSFNFASGANNTFLSYCVTVNGNVLNVVTPAGQQHIFGREGYGICDINSNTEYFDYAVTGDTPNWNPAVVVSKTATSVKIARNTSDGIWTLTQTITQMPATSSIKVTMTVKNNTVVNREVQLSRFADIDATGTTLNTLDSTINDAMIFNSVGRAVPFGLALQNVGTSPFTYLGFIRNTSAALAPCTPFTNQAIGPVVNTDGTAVMTYVVPVPARASKTVTVTYRGL
jgi:hypothetical protein